MLKRSENFGAYIFYKDVWEKFERLYSWENNKK